MTENNMNNAQQLKAMLGDESAASLSDILGVIENLPRSDDGVEPFKDAMPVDMFYRYFSGRGKCWGISEHYFWALNNKVSECDFKDYFKCIEALPDIEIAAIVIRLMVWGMGKEDCQEMLAAFSRQLPPFLSEGKWNGGKSAFLALRGAIDCVDWRQEGPTSVVLSIVRNRMGLERTVLAVAAIALVVRALSGNLNEEEGWRGTTRHSREIQLLDLYKTLKAENEDCLKKVSFSMIAPMLFGLDVERDWNTTEPYRKAGLSAKGGLFSYAEAIIVACASGIVLTRDECIKVSTLALYCADRSHMWRLIVFRPVALFMADLIAGFDDSKAVWQEIRSNTRHLIYRGLHEYPTGATVSFSDRVEIFVGAAFALVCDYCDKGRKRDAMEVWAVAWSECVTALYALTLMRGFVPLIQYFFVKAGMCFTNETEIVPSGLKLLEQLPLVEVTPDQRVDCAELCVNALKGNLDDVARSRIKEKDPELWKLLNADDQLEPLSVVQKIY